MHLERALTLHGTYRDRFDRPQPVDGRPSRWRVKPLRVPKVVDVTQYAHRGRTSGIPRVVRALITSDAAAEYVPVVWDRGALAPVKIDTSGDVTFPKQYWRRIPRLPRLHRLYLRVRASRPGLATAGLLGMLGVGRIVAIVLEVIERGPRRRTRARVNVLLGGSELLVPEVPRGADVETLLTLLDDGGDVSVRLFVHDLLPLTHPEHFERSAVHDHVNLLRLAHASTDLMTSSAPLAAQLEATLVGLFGDSPPIRHAPLPVTGLTPPPAGRPRPGRTTLLFVGGFEARKGLEALLDALERARDWPFEVVVVGAPRHHRQEELLTARRASRLPMVRRVGPVSDRRLGELLADASAVLYLSAAEGYGLPVLEALAAGRPVICADTPINRLFDERHGGLVRVPVRGRAVCSDDLHDVLRDAPWRHVDRTTIRTASIPTDPESWARWIIEGTG